MSNKLDLRSPGAIEVNSAMFYDVQVAIIRINGTAYMIANDVGRALGYERPRNIRKHYDELRDDQRLLLKHNDFKLLRREASESEASNFDPHARSITLVTQGGAEHLAMLARTDRGFEFRNWISDVVLPAHRERVANQASEQPRKPPQGPSSQGTYDC